MNKNPARKTNKPRHAASRQRVRRGNAEDAERTRDSLLAAAEKLFAEQGLEAVTIRAVAALAGMSAMTPYRYFADKAELLAGLWQSVLSAVHQRMVVAIGAHRGGRARQRASLDAFLGYWEEHPDHYRLVYMTEQTTRGSEAAFVSVPIYKDMLDLVQGVTKDLAAEIGADMTHAKIAGDIRFTMLLGYLNAQLVNRRYPWSDPKSLRAAYIEQIIATVERCLLEGAGTALQPIPRARTLRPRAA